MYFLLQKESHRQWWPMHLHRFTAQKWIKRRCSFFYLLALCANPDSPAAWSSQITEITWSLRRGCIRSKKHSFSVGETFRGLGKGGTAKKKSTQVSAFAYGSWLICFLYWEILQSSYFMSPSLSLFSCCNSNLFHFHLRASTKTLHQKNKPDSSATTGEVGVFSA